MSALAKDIINAIVNSDCEDVFAYLGHHRTASGKHIVRVFLPNAKNVKIVNEHASDCLATADVIHTAGLYEAKLGDADPGSYKLSVNYGEYDQIVDDPYRFASQIGEQDLYLFGEGTHERIYEFLGATPFTVDGIRGVRFCLWAPNARRVSVVGDFNYWDGRKHMMRKHVPSGIWEIFIPGVNVGALYKFELRSRDGELLPHKADPCGFYAQCPPEQASVVADHSTYQWQDQSWSNKKSAYTKRDKPISIYEVQLGSWKRVPEENNRYFTYRELADDLIPYVKHMGFTHLQLMPVSEYPFDGSWGYQPVGLFAPTSRFGGIDDFKYFVDKAHQSDIAVLIDWVPGHFPTDGHGLGRFDGTPLYEHSDSRQGFHPDWNTYIYNYGRTEVSGFLMSNALYWLDYFHIDGLRVDAVASMLYLDYSREHGEWIPNRHGGRENLEAIDFLRKVNERVYANYPDVMMVAEESTAWPGVTQPTSYGGLGFGFKWNMGWMNDSLEYISKEPVHRQHHHHDLTFSLYYAFSENFILPLSHDEVVHGKGSILARMPGDAWQKFANIRAYYGFMWTHPGKKLLFMGCEFAQGPEWDHQNSVCWHQLQLPEHQGVQSLVKDLNRLYTELPELHELDSDGAGFEWVEADDHHHSVFAFIRKGHSSEKDVLVIGNFTPVPRQAYRIGVSKPGFYRECLNTDSEIYGGANIGNAGGLQSESVPWHYRDESIVVNLPPLSTMIFQLQ